MFQKTKLVRCLLIAFGGTLVLAEGALAQDTDIQRVEITGTNIRRTNSETPAPVQVITAQDIKESGFTSIQDVLHSITANGQGTLSQGFSGAFASGAAGLRVRDGWWPHGTRQLSAQRPCR